MNEAIASLIDRSELVDSVLVPYFVRSRSTRRPGGTAYGFAIELNTPYIDCDLFKYGLQELTEWRYDG